MQRKSFDRAFDGAHTMTRRRFCVLGGSAGILAITGCTSAAAVEQTRNAGRTTAVSRGSSSPRVSQEPGVRRSYAPSGVDVSRYGASGDGSTDDTAAITTAIAAVGSGGALYFPAGVYRVDGLALSVSGQTWTLHRDAVLKLADGSSTLNTLAVRKVRKFTLRGGVIDGNRARNRGGDHFQIHDSSGVVIEDVRVRNAVDYGLLLAGCTNSAVRFCTFEGGGAASLTIAAGANGAPSSDIVVSDCVATTSRSVFGPNSGGFGSSGASAESPNRRISFLRNRLTLPTPRASDNSGCLYMGNTRGGAIVANVCVGSGISISLDHGAQSIAVNSNTITGFYNYGIEFAGAASSSAKENVIDAGSSVTWPISMSAGARAVSVVGGTLSSGPRGGACVQVQSSQDVTLKAVTMTARASAASCVVLNSADSVVIEGCSLESYSTSAPVVQIIGGDGAVSVRGNKFTASVPAAVQFSSSVSVTSSKLVVEGNILSGPAKLLAVTGRAHTAK